MIAGLRVLTPWGAYFVRRTAKAFKRCSGMVIFTGHIL